MSACCEKCGLTMSLPEVIYGDGNQALEIDGDGGGGMMLFLYINFVIQERNIRGYIAIVMDLHSIASLRQLIAAFIARMSGEDFSNAEVSRRLGHC
jgi:chemotaxis protein CheC